MLEGLKIVEMATYVAAPGAGGIMADWGADVIKVEPPGGDPIRMFFSSLGVEEAAEPGLRHGQSRQARRSSSTPQSRQAATRC